jgi:signal transduction histidine kinase/DNA-binding response OmpR family regulator/ligand-binding sensor domain-containing protein
LYNLAIYYPYIFIVLILYIIGIIKYYRLRQSNIFIAILRINRNGNYLKKYIVILITGIFCNTTISSVAQTKYIFNTKRLTVKDGLAHQEVYDIYQDSRGFMWMATRSGLSRYDGYKFTNFTREQNGLSNNSIHALMEDSAGYLWLFSRENVSWQSKLLSIDLLYIANGEVKNIAAIFPDCPFKEKELERYFFSKKKELFLFSKNRLWKYTSKEGFTTIKIPHAFRPEASSETDNGIWGFLDNTLVKIDSSGKIITAGELGDKGNSRPVYFGNNFGYILNNGRDLKRYDLNTNHSLPLLPLQYTDKGIEIINYDSLKKQTWIAGAKTLFLLDEQGKLIYSFDPNSEVVLERVIRKIYIDRTGLAWVASESGVLIVEVKKDKFSRYLHSQKNNKEFIPCRGILQEGNNLYVGTYKGHFRVNLKDNVATKLNELKENSANIGDRSVISKSSGKEMYWVAKYPILANSETGEELKFFKGKKAASWCAYVDGKNRLFIGTVKGLFIYDKAISDTVSSFKDYNQFKELANCFIISIIKDRSGIIWIVTNNGLYILDESKGIVAHYGTGEKKPNTLLTDDIQHLYQDGSGIYWLSTASAGLIKWNRRTSEQTKYSKKNGLSSNNLYATYEDARGFLWISSDYGIMRFNKKDEQVTVYTPEDGITHYEFNRISHFQAPDGHIYFGGMNGVTGFYPEDFYDSSSNNTNQLMIASFQQFIGAKEMLMDITSEFIHSGKIILNPSDKFFSLSLAVPDYINIGKTVYQYMIEGIDADWVKTTNNEIRFGRLPYGKHTLKLRAQMANGNFTKEVNIDINVKRPWYLKWWFYLFLVSLAVFASQSFYKWRIIRLKERERELENIVAERTKELEEDKTIIKQQADELLEMDEMKSKFFANVSHELRTPLSLIVGPANRLLQQIDKKSNSYEYLQIMQQNIAQLQSRVNEILELSKLDAGKLVLNEQAIFLAQFMEPIVASFDSYAGQKNIKFSYKFLLPKNTANIVDPDKLKKILYNLLSNAVKFTSSNGEVELSVLENTSQLIFRVSDTGKGIHLDEQQLVFNRFYQSKRNTESVLGGTGIGLALTNELVALMNGKISIESELGKGAVFTIEIPKKETNATLVLREPAILNESVGNVEITNKGATILLVEDNLNLQRYIKLELKDCNVITVNNGSEALVYLTQLSQLPQLIISDIMMPVMDGFTLLEQLKANDLWRKIPVIMLTARADTQDRLKALRIGVDDYLLKPFITVELVARINNLLSRYNPHMNDELDKSEEEVVAGDIEEVISDTLVSSAWLQQLEVKVLQYLDKQENFTLDILADEISISKRQLQRNIKEETGLTPTNYIKEIRLHRARIYLENKKFATVTEVSNSVGFNDPHYFSTLYIARFGKKPIEYFDN